MAYGLQITNPSGGLVLSSDAFGLNFVGKATLYSTTANSNTGVGYLTYRITTATPPLVFMKLVQGDFWYCLRSVTDVGGGVWEIQITATSGVEGSSNASNTSAAYATLLSGVDVYCFARPTSVTDTYGLAIYDKDGALAWDLGRRCLFLREALAYSTGVVLATTSVSAPAVLGDARMLRNKSYSSGGGLYRAFNYQGAWGFPSAGTIQRTGQRDSFDGIEDAPLNTAIYYATDVLVIDSAQYD